MERLTVKSVIVSGHYNLKCMCGIGRDDQIDDEDGCRAYCSDECDGCGIQEAFDRLAAYEDTGYEPEEIKALREDNVRLHKLLDDHEAVLVSKPEEHNNSSNNNKVHCKDCAYLNIDDGKPYCCHSRMSTNGLDDWCNFGRKRQVGR